METTEELIQFLRENSDPRSRGRLIARGAARAIIRQDGILPEGAPAFAPTIDVDLSEVGFSLLRASLALKEAGGDLTIWRDGFERAGNFFEALVQNGATDDVARGFNRVIGAAAYHLAGKSALAFSLMSRAVGEQNLAPVEEAIVSLILRNLDRLSDQARNWLLDPTNNDEVLAQRLNANELDPDDAISSVITSTIYRAFAFFQFALQTGELSLVEQAKSLLESALLLSKRANAVSLWWVSRVAANLIDDLWSNSLHETLPKQGPSGTQTYEALRRLFIGELYTRKTSEVELWPSQISAARRSTDLSDDLVVALPTSAGKTRVAEIAALMTLACDRRVLLVTPLRALSAQTERSFRRTFSPLGFTISSLYGAAGLAGSDEDALNSRDIVVATPEKLDFALRNDIAIIDDIGLVVLDEGHLIGPSDREIRYENLVQRLLRRSDSHTRRIVCLSAVLPEGEQGLNDLTAWIRSDAPGEPIQSNWRPTRQRYGTLSWHQSSAKPNFDLEAGAPFIEHFVRQTPAIKPRKLSFPKDNRELTLAAAWKFSSLGKRVLIFCTQRDHVEGYADAVVDLTRRGFLPSLLVDPEKVERAISVGREWLGAEHPAVKCLALGVAIHHARLPNPFLREVEALLSSGVLEVVIASPTLAQGLNLNAAVLLVPTIYRAGKLLTGEEFANVAGRAGRAFVDLEGLIVHVMLQPATWRVQQWKDLVKSGKTRSLLSGIITIVDEVMRRLAATGVFNRDDAMQYLANSQEAWFPPNEDQETEATEALIERLDSTVLGLIEALDAPAADLPALLEAALTGSLWARQIARSAPEEKSHQLWIMEARARLIWNKSTAMQRRAQFAMGVGLEAGLAIDAAAEELTAQLNRADLAAIRGDAATLAANLIAMADRLLQISPFNPEEPLPGNWRELLTAWVTGRDVAEIGVDNMRFVEDVFIYRLTWAVEAIRMRRRASGGQSDFPEGGAAACLETGLPQSMMATLVRSGLPSRVAAQEAVRKTNASFVALSDMNEWLSSNEITALTDDPKWPTPSTADLWRRFREDALAAPIRRWSEQNWEIKLAAPIISSHPGRIQVDAKTGEVSVTTPDYWRLTGIKQALSQGRPSLLRVDFAHDGRSARIERMGPGNAR